MFGKRFFGRITLMALAAAALGAVVMLLWNAVVPALFSTALPLDYVHALGLLLLCRILFGGLRGHGGHGHRHWAKWQAMTDEERADFKRQIHAARRHHHGLHEQ